MPGRGITPKKKRISRHKGLLWLPQCPSSWSFMLFRPKCKSPPSLTTLTLSTQHSEHITSDALGDLFRNRGEIRTFVFPSLSVTHTARHAHARKWTHLNALPSGDGGRCAQAPPCFPKTHGMRLWSLCNVTQHQWEAASLLTTMSLSSSSISPPTPCSASVCPPLYFSSTTPLIPYCREEEAVKRSHSVAIYWCHKRDELWAMVGIVSIVTLMTA